MPQDLFRWEDGNALVHHCPNCQTPLTHARCKTKCLAKHVEWCKKYHCQLFKKGSSQLCMACISSDETHQKRHRQIAELLRQLEKTREAAATAPKPINGQQFVLPSDTCTSKRERKAAKKIEKAAMRPKVVGEEEMRKVCHALHPPEDHASEEEERERLLNDPAIKSNLPFHPGTSCDRHLRIELIANDAKNEFKVTKEEMTRIKLELGVPEIAKGMTIEERRLVKEVITAIKEDMLIIHREEEETMQRKAGFWRWASRKAYVKLVQSGSIKGAGISKIDMTPEDDEEDGLGDENFAVEDLNNLALDDSSDADASATDASAATSRTGSISEASTGTTESGHLTSATSETASSSISSSSSDIATPKIKQQDAWQIVGRKSNPNISAEIRTPTSIKLSANKGLHHLRSRKDPSSHNFNGFARLSDSDLDSDHADRIYDGLLHLTPRPGTYNAEKKGFNQGFAPSGSRKERLDTKSDEEDSSPLRWRTHQRPKES